MPKIIATTENVDQLFEGVMIPREHTEEPYTNAIYTRQPTPGWKCKACGWITSYALINMRLSALRHRELNVNTR